MESFTLRCVTFFFLAITSSRVALSVIILECDSLQQLCPDDNQPRTCVCNVTGSALSWDTSISGGITFGAGAGVMAGATDSALSDSGGVFSAVLTERATGLNSSSILMFDPSTIRAAGGPVNVSCSDSASLVDLINTTSITVTSADAPSARQLSILNTGCDLDNTSYQINLQWNDGDTGGPDVSILYYLVEVTSSPPGFVCPPDQCNVTDSTTTITGLSCSTEYNFTVRAVNCNGSSTASMLQTSSRITTPSIDQACFVNDKIRISLQDDYNTVSGNCTVNNFNISSNCTGDLINTDYGPGDTVANLTVPGGSPSDACVVTVVAVADCGYSTVPATITTDGNCSTVPSVTPSPTMTTSPTTGMGSLAGPAGGAGGAAAAIVSAALVMAVIFVCMFCPCRCCMPCRRKCCGCCPEEKICYRWGSDDEYCEPTPHVEKQPVLQSYSTETKEKDVETGQLSYPSSAGPMYQDPNTIQRQAAPTGDLYAQPEKPARHQKQKPAPAPVEMATYQDPNTIQRQAAPTGDLYAQPDKTPRQPSGPAPLYSEVNKSNQLGGTVYADLSLSESSANTRRPPQVPDTVYSEVVKDTRN